MRMIKFLRKKIISYTKKISGLKKINLERFHEYYEIEKLNNLRVKLYDKINLKLGSTDDRSMFAALTEEQKSIKKYLALVKKTPNTMTTIIPIGNGQQFTVKVK